MNHRSEILTYSLTLEEKINNSITYTFNVPIDNTKLLKYFKKIPVSSKLEILKDLSLLSNDEISSISLLFSIRNNLLHNIEISQYAHITDPKIIKAILKEHPTLPSEFTVTTHDRQNLILTECIAKIFEKALYILSMVESKTKKINADKIMTEKQKEVLEIYKAFSKAMHQLFLELPNYKITGKRIEEIKERYMDIFTEKLKSVYPEKLSSDQDSGPK